MKQLSGYAAKRFFHSSLQNHCVSQFTPDLMPNLISDRFQGALLGLWLVPTAVSLGRARSDSPVDSPASGLENPADSLAKAAVFGLDQTQAFLSAPSLFKLSSTSRLRPEDRPSARLSVLLASLPGLLRYHDSGLRRERWVSAQLSAVSGLEQQMPAITAQVLTLGDGLEMVFGSTVVFAAPWLLERLFQLESRATQYRLSGDRSNLIAAIVSAFTAESYGLSVQLAAQQSEEAALIAGLVAGALGGRASLPVLWQMQASRLSNWPDHLGPNQTTQQRSTQQRLSQWPSRQAVVALADRLFDQWAGIHTATF